jgi:hypothetical protein
LAAWSVCPSQVSKSALKLQNADDDDDDDDVAGEDELARKRRLGEELYAGGERR